MAEVIELPAGEEITPYAVPEEEVAPVPEEEVAPVVVEDVPTPSETPPLPADDAVFIQAGQPLTPQALAHVRAQFNNTAATNFAGMQLVDEVAYSRQALGTADQLARAAARLVDVEQSLQKTPLSDFIKEILTPAVQGYMATRVPQQQQQG